MQRSVSLFCCLILLVSFSTRLWLQEFAAKRAVKRSLTDVDKVWLRVGVPLHPKGVEGVLRSGLCAASEQSWKSGVIRNSIVGCSVKISCNWNWENKTKKNRVSTYFCLQSVCTGGVLVLGGLLVPQSVTWAISDLESGPTVWWGSWLRPGFTRWSAFLRTLKGFHNSVHKWALHFWKSFNTQKQVLCLTLLGIRLQNTSR